MTWARLAFRLQRFELIALSLTVLAWSGAALFIAWTLGGFVAQYPDCFGLTTVSQPYCEDASVVFGAWDQTAEALLWLVLALPLIIGIILASPIVASEVEHQTAQVAWSYAINRVRWLAGRTLPVLSVGLALLAVLAAVAEVLAAARLAGDDPGFQRFDQRGPLVVVRGFVAFAVALLLGTLIGRTLPALLAASVLAGVLIFGQIMVLDVWRRAEAELIELNSPMSNELLPTAMILEPAAVLPDGGVVAGRSAQLPEGANFDHLLIIPGSDYWLWVGRETAVLTTLGVLALMVSAGVVNRRRPV